VLVSFVVLLAWGFGGLFFMTVMRCGLGIGWMILSLIADVRSGGAE